MGPNVTDAQESQWNRNFTAWFSVLRPAWFLCLFCSNLLTMSSKLSVNRSYKRLYLYFSELVTNSVELFFCCSVYDSFVVIFSSNNAKLTYIFVDHNFEIIINLKVFNFLLVNQVKNLDQFSYSKC